MGRLNHNELTSYDDCVERLDGKVSRKLRNNVQLMRDGTDILVVYHATTIVRYRPDGTIVLSTGGWDSASTKANLNRYTGFSVWMKDGVWFVGAGLDDTREFVDGMELTGSPSSAVSAV